MNTNTNHKSNDESFDDLFKFKDQEAELKHDAYIEMSGYLSEIENIQRVYNVNRKELAKKINTSASYLTQVFRGDKPLNFFTIAKIRKALNIRFDVRAIVLKERFTSNNTPAITFAPISNLEMIEKIEINTSQYTLTVTAENKFDQPSLY